MIQSSDDVYQPLVCAMRAIAQELLGLMQQALRGELPDEALYVRAFGAKEGMVPQLQKIGGIIEEMRALERECSPVVPVQAEVSAHEKALIAHYLQAYKDAAQD